MKIDYGHTCHVDDSVYFFPDITRSGKDLIHAPLWAIAFVEDCRETWAINPLNRSSAIRQIAAYNNLFDLQCRWITVCENGGFHNPTTPYEGQDPNLYKEK